jgi:hypothetical protein
MEAEIKDSLNLLLNSINKSDGRAVAEQMGRLEDLLARGRAGLHPQLVHFLERRSYAKALTFLGGDPVPAGTCTPKAGARG